MQTLSLISSEARETVRQLAPYCERIEIAGSIRRLEPTCKDIELVCIPDVCCYREFQRLVERWPKLKGEAAGRHTKRRLLTGTVLDLSICNPKTWPVIFTLRTGCAEFSRELVTRANKLDTPSLNGRIIGRDGHALDLVTEEDVFLALQVPYVKPQHRTPQVADRLSRLPYKAVKEFAR